MSLSTLAARIQYAGGDQVSRINTQKLRSLKAAFKNDYNSRIMKTPLQEAWPCLINHNNLKPDYDKKIVSVEFDSQLQPGDVFELIDDGTHWMVYLPFITETAYLRSEIIRCRYTLEINDKLYWVYFQGPTETDLRWFIKNQINVNELNLSGTIYIKNDENTKQFFKRFTRIKIEGHTWEVQVTDSISVPGIIELEVQEYYDNTIEELPEIKLHPDISIDPESIIRGDTLVKPDSIVGYSVKVENIQPDAKWIITDNPRVKIVDTMEDNRICKVRIYPGTVDPFTLQYGDNSLTVNIDWESPIIHGPVEVYPYDTCIYTTDFNADFALPSNLAKIIDVTNNSCHIEITTGKTGQFSLFCRNQETQEISELEIEIKSL